MASISDIKGCPWNEIHVANILDAINPRTCIRCLQLKATPGVDTICPECHAYLSASENSAERFLFFACLRIYNFSLWVRRKTLCDKFVLRDTEEGTLVQHFIGMPGDKQDLPSLMTVRKPDHDDGEDGKIVTLSSMEEDLLQQVLLTSRQCDKVLVLLASVMKSELLQANSPVAFINEIVFEANHTHTSTHWCYRATLKCGRQFAVAFTDRQLGWLHIVRAWDEYVLDRFHPDDEENAVYYVESSENEPDEVTDDEKASRAWWMERGVRVSRLGGVQRAHLSQYYPQDNWTAEAKQKWIEELPPFDVVEDDRPKGWRPEQGLSADKIVRRQRRYGCHLVRDNGTQSLWDNWERDMESAEVI